jgi:hypothetical protein
MHVSLGLSETPPNCNPEIRLVIIELSADYPKIFVGSSLDNAIERLTSVIVLGELVYTSDGPSVAPVHRVLGVFLADVCRGALVKY